MTRDELRARINELVGVVAADGSRAGPVCDALDSLYREAAREAAPPSVDAREVLREVEWVDWGRAEAYCPYCGAAESLGHMLDCRLSAALQSQGD
jgi:hypothetical protein